MKPRVFVLTHSQFDLADAADYGDIVYLFGAEKRLPSPLSAVFAQETWHALKQNDYDPDTDFLLVLGSQAALVQWVAAVISQVQFCKALVFEATHSRYVIRTLGFEHVESEDEENPTKREPQLV
jgi:hypothetical protein